MAKWWIIDDFGVLTINAELYIKENGNGVLPTATNQEWLTEYNKSDITKIEFVGKGLSFPENSSCFFRLYENVTEIVGLENVSTRNVTDMSWMFHSMYSLTELDVSSFDTSNVTNMAGMFRKMHSLTELDVSSFDTTNVTDMSGMFQRMYSLKKLDVSNFDTSNVTNMAIMFEQTSAKVKLWDM